MTKKIIMMNAWNIARNGVKRHGGKASDYISEAMKIAWNLYKEMKNKKGGKVAGFADWFLRKEFVHPSAVQQIVESVYAIKKETKKAFLVIATAFEGGVEITNEFWAPKSVCI